jgi:hypothetical protein
MFNTDDLNVDCNTCVAANTTACTECVVGHLLANDAGPINFVPVPLFAEPSHAERAVALLAAAGLVADDPEWVSASDFAAGGVPHLAVPQLTSLS